MKESHSSRSESSELSLGHVSHSMISDTLKAFTLRKLPWKLQEANYTLTWSDSPAVAFSITTPHSPSQMRDAVGGSHTAVS